MKKLFALLTVCCFISAMSIAQNTLPALDKSPMDVSYCPANYPYIRLQDKPIDPLTARIIYSRPQKNGRAIFGTLVKYGEVWRMGANEATEITFFKPVTIDGKKVDAGRYTMYCIPDSNKWTMIINTETDIWGAYKYDQKKDLLRVDVPVQKQTTSTEALVIVFQKSATGADLVVVWDDVKAVLPIAF